MKRMVAVTGLALVLAALQVQAVGAGAGARRASRYLVVGTDAPGDWGKDVHAAIAPGGGALGQDLVAAAIGMNRSNIDFTLQFASLPSEEEALAASKYRWAFGVDGRRWLLASSFDDCSAATAGADQDCVQLLQKGLAAFALVDHDALSATIVPAAVAVSRRTITVSVPARTIGVRPGSRITVDPEGGKTCVAAMTQVDANVTNKRTPTDFLSVTRAFVVPR